MSKNVEWHVTAKPNAFNFTNGIISVFPTRQRAREFRNLLTPSSNYTIYRVETLEVLQRFACKDGKYQLITKVS